MQNRYDVNQKSRVRHDSVKLNAEQLVYVITILLLMTEVDKDMIANADIARFLAGVAHKGDQMRIMDPPSPNSTRSRPDEEEKTAECDDDLDTEHDDTVSQQTEETSRSPLLKEIGTTNSLPADEEAIADIKHEEKSHQTETVTQNEDNQLG